MDIETTKVVLQAAALIVLLVGLLLTIRQIRLLRLSYVDLHDWNRRKAAQDAVDNVEHIAADTPLLDGKFQIMSKNDPIALKSILGACESTVEVQTAIHRRLNWFESLAGGVKQGVFDEEVIKDAYQRVFRSTHRQFSEYIDHRRNADSYDAWSEFGDMIERWDQEDKASASRRKQTGAVDHPIRARKSKGG